VTRNGRIVVALCAGFAISALLLQFALKGGTPARSNFLFYAQWPGIYLALAAYRLGVVHGARFLMFTVNACVYGLIVFAALQAFRRRSIESR
jgi:uncharacterized integral membrane protein